jgi:hypothetical protein
MCLILCTLYFLLIAFIFLLLSGTLVSVATRRSVLAVHCCPLLGCLCVCLPHSLCLSFIVAWFVVTAVCGCVCVCVCVFCLWVCVCVCVVGRRGKNTRESEGEGNGWWCMPLCERRDMGGNTSVMPGHSFTLRCGVRARACVCVCVCVCVCENNCLFLF